MFTIYNCKVGLGTFEPKHSREQSLIVMGCFSREGLYQLHTNCFCVQLIKALAAKCLVTINDCFLLHLSLNVHQACFIFYVAMGLYNIICNNTIYLVEFDSYNALTFNASYCNIQ